MSIFGTTEKLMKSTICVENLSLEKFNTCGRLKNCERSKDTRPDRKGVTLSIVSIGQNRCFVRPVSIFAG